MSNVDINVDRRTDGWTDGQKIGHLYRTLLQAGAIKTLKLLSENDGQMDGRQTGRNTDDQCETII